MSNVTNVSRKPANAEARTVARLAVAFALLEMAPYGPMVGNTGESPVDMAVYVVEMAKEKGNLGKVEHALGIWEC